MKVCLLYADRERATDASYYDPKSIIQDLGLESLFLVASKEMTYEDGAVKKVEEKDPFLVESLRKIMMIPLTSQEEITFRQEIVADSLRAPDMIREMYRISSETLVKWNELGRGIREKIRMGNPVVRLTTEIRVLHLLCDAITVVRNLVEQQKELASQGLVAFREELRKAFSEEREAYVRKILADISFYTDGLDQKDEGRDQVVKPRIVFECGMEDGLKFSSLKLQEVASVSTKFYRRGSTRDKLQKFINSWMPDSFSTIEESRIREQTQTLEYGIVNYLVKRLRWVTDEFQTFFDQLRFQSAFYLGAIHLKQNMDRFGLRWCFPKVCDRRDLEFTDLREFVMALEQRVRVIGNSCSLPQKDLLIVTGANQGGKSTFLRSIGIAQVMMQCGLPVTALTFRSGIFPKIFVHFTRREDSAMNSGRLDEELSRMNGIVEHIGDGSLVLLNESFATTTEKEGSVIAYDIIRALKEAGVRILTVTHLLSFAKRVYGETKDNPESGVEFLSAERLPDGRRTYRMIRSEPELTSFGLDLYDEIVGKNT
jgi:DNA mismatch repair ATPase MutS